MAGLPALAVPTQLIDRIDPPGIELTCGTCLCWEPTNETRVDRTVRGEYADHRKLVETKVNGHVVATDVVEEWTTHDGLVMSHTLAAENGQVLVYGNGGSWEVSPRGLCSCTCHGDELSAERWAVVADHYGCEAP